MQKTRSITIELPEPAVTILERVATQEHATLQSFVQQRLAELVKFIKRPRPELPEAPADAGPGQYL